MPDTSIWRDRLAKCRLINADLSQVDETKLPSGDLLIFKETKAKIEFCLDSLGKNASYRNNPSFYSAVPSLRKSRSDSAQTASVLKAMPEFYQKAKNCIALHEANRGFDKAVAQCLDGLRLLDTIALEMPRMGAHTKTAKTALKDYIAFTKSCAFEFGHRKANVK